MPLVFVGAVKSVGAEVFRFGGFALADKSTHFFKIIIGFGIVPFAETARPYGILIELYKLVRRFSENHSAQSAVSHGESLVPVFSGGFIP